ncbi:hypothetical protein QVD17_00661 [Tagetes erecta]|uniref:Uncharacterized protein n=1 Tax=Tagetes erecta TaxID=13708 RepID=A0AAD8L926_TARER|nr:hypothetical protein QVD17_00661 [Tagetes erecta]
MCCVLSSCSVLLIRVSCWGIEFCFGYTCVVWWSELFSIYFCYKYAILPTSPTKKKVANKIPRRTIVASTHRLRDCYARLADNGDGVFGRYLMFCLGLMHVATGVNLMVVIALRVVNMGFAASPSDCCCQVSLRIISELLALRLGFLIFVSFNMFMVLKTMFMILEVRPLDIGKFVGDDEKINFDSL